MDSGIVSYENAASVFVQQDEPAAGREFYIRPCLRVGPAIAPASELFVRVMRDAGRDKVSTVADLERLVGKREAIQTTADLERLFRDGAQ